MATAGGRLCAKCGCRLSRYNDADRCSACARSVGTTALGAVRIPQQVWTDPDVRSAVSSWDFGLASRLIRQRSGLRQEDVAALTGLSQAFLSMLESGTRRLTNLDKVIEFLVGLEVPDELVQVPIPGRPRKSASGLPEAPRSPRRVAWEDALTIARRAQSMACVNVDDATLVALQSSIDDIVERYEAEGPQSLATPTIELRGIVHDLLSGSQHPRQRHELYVLAAKTSGLLGYMAVNAGRLPTARSYCAEALQLATTVEDHSLVAWLRGTQSLEAYYDGRYAEAHELAVAGVRSAPDSPQSIRLLANGAARALGKQGDRAGAERAAHQALELAQKFDTPAGLTPCISFSPYGHARTLANVATAYVSLGDVPRVLECAQQVEAHVQAADSAWSRALVSLDVASALMQQPQAEVEQAMALGQTALQSSSSHPIRSVVQRAHELEQQAIKWRRLPAVRDYVDAFGGRGPPRTSYANIQPPLPAASRDPRSPVMPVHETTTPSAVFPVDAPPSLTDPQVIADHDWQAFCSMSEMGDHWNRPGWGPDTRRYYWFLTVEHSPAVARLAHTCQAPLADFGFDLVSDEGLHVTVARIGDAGDINSQTLSALSDTAKLRCEQILPFELQAIPVAGSRGAVRLSLAPWEPLWSLHRATTGIGKEVGLNGHGSTHNFRPHLGVAYSNRKIDAARVRKKIQGLRGLEPQVFEVRELRLVELRRENRTYCWNVIHSVQLGGSGEA